ncbi:hypothetical protein FRB99_004302 [Tulasnella sp. 403]|nr:hypothetical protein FRB99_004302 [Tulasnella sp. 403]
MIAVPVAAIWAGKVVLGAAGAYMLAPVAVASVGFTSAGVAAGSFAAAAQGPAVAAGSWFATMQAFGATSTVTAAGIAKGAAVVAAAIAL